MDFCVGIAVIEIIEEVTRMATGNYFLSGAFVDIFEEVEFNESQRSNICSELAIKALKHLS